MYNGLFFKMVNDLTGIEYNDYLMLAFESGCEYAYKKLPSDHALDILTTDSGFWPWWMEEWLEMDRSFILDANCAAKEFRQNKKYNQEQYVFIHRATLPRLTSPISLLLQTNAYG